MEINTNTLQLGQSFAESRVVPNSGTDIARSVIEENQATEQQTKENLKSAETVEREASDEVRAAQIDAAVSQLGEFLQNNNRQLDFSVDKASNKQVVKVTDAESGEIIRQIPSEEVLKLSERLQELQTDVGNAVGLLFSKQV